MPKINDNGVIRDMTPEEINAFPEELSIEPTQEEIIMQRIEDIETVICELTEIME